MGSLSFTYGMVMSGKTAKLIRDVQSETKKNFLIMKPDTDFEIKNKKIESRNGSYVEADIIVTKNTDLCSDISYAGIEKIYVDEAQFLSAEHINQLRALTNDKNMIVKCYGIRTDFKSFLFEGAKRLFEVCDKIEEVEKKCDYCDQKASHNIKVIDGKPQGEGETIGLSELFNEIYFPSCYSCYSHFLKTKKIE